MKVIKQIWINGKYIKFKDGKYSHSDINPHTLSTLLSLLIELKFNFPQLFIYNTVANSHAENHAVLSHFKKSFQSTPTHYIMTTIQKLWPLWIKTDKNSYIFMVWDKIVLKFKEKNKDTRRIKKFWRKIYEVGGLPYNSKTL